MTLAVQNRNLSYLNILDSLPKRRSEVYKAIEDLEKASLDDVCHYLKSQKNEISGRITELCNAFLIEPIGIKKGNKSNNSVTVYRILNRNETINKINLKYGKLIEVRDSLLNDLHKGKEFLSSYSIEQISYKISKVNKDINYLKKLLDGSFGCEKI